MTDVSQKRNDRGEPEAEMTEVRQKRNERGETEAQMSEVRQRRKCQRRDRGAMKDSSQKRNESGGTDVQWKILDRIAMEGVSEMRNERCQVDGSRTGKVTK